MTPSPTQLVARTRIFSGFRARFFCINQRSRNQDNVPLSNRRGEFTSPFGGAAPAGPPLRSNSNTTETMLMPRAQFLILPGFARYPPEVLVRIDPFRRLPPGRRTRAGEAQTPVSLQCSSCPFQL